MQFDIFARELRRHFAVGQRGLGDGFDHVELQRTFFADYCNDAGQRIGGCFEELNGVHASGSDREKEPY